MTKTISEGSIEGIILIVNSIEDISKINLNDKIIVTKRLDSQLLSYLFDVKGIIVEEGSLLSHVAIFLREASIPCKLIPDATKIYKQGDKIKID